EGDRERCLAAGATDYLAKPLQIDDLVGLLQRLLEGGRKDLTDQVVTEGKSQ
ncbi:MAG TPA: hypothetical protein IGR64_14680, partial [Leptolyngbyaceae cyanobacterium M65_K2018_010]|nr:hypothetical protein [Leptolyngbyaceae cyanobacterium M65_K2018_010]